MMWRTRNWKVMVGACGCAVFRPSEAKVAEANSRKIPAGREQWSRLFSELRDNLTFPEVPAANEGCNRMPSDMRCMQSL